MITTDKMAFAQLLFITTHKYHRTFSQSLLEIYWHCLKDYSLVDIKAAFLTYSKKIDDTRWMPHPSEILRILTGDSPAQTALGAWTKVCQAIWQVGRYPSIVFDDFLIHAVIEAMGGWITLCQKTDEEFTVAALEFQKRYIRYLRYHPLRYSRHLIGLLEHQHHIHSQPIPEPLLFGNQPAALLTYLEGVKPDALSGQPNPSLPFMRSAHQLMVDVVKTLSQSDVKTENTTEPLSQPASSPAKRSTHESE